MNQCFKSCEAPLYVISDLHLGCGRRDNFKNPARINQLLNFLSHVEKEQGRLIILGDLFDLWRFSLSSIVRNHTDILGKLSEIDCVYIPGNHDMGIRDIPDSVRENFKFLDNVSQPLSLPIGQKQFVFCHGHEVDSLNKYIKPSFGKVLGHLAMVIEHFAAAQIFDSDNIRAAIFQAEAAAAQLWATMVLGLNRFITESLTIQSLAVELLKHNHNIKTISRYKEFIEKDHTVITAHTHCPGHFKDCYYNSGSWALGNTDFLKITPKGSVDVLKWTKTNGMASNGCMLA